MPFAIGAGVLVVALIALFASGVFDSEDPTAASTTIANTTTTTSGTVTTTGGVTTTGATTTTTVATTTTTLPSVTDTFDGTTLAAPLLGEAFMQLTITDRGRGRLRAVQVPGVLPAMYPDPVGDAFTVSLTIRLELKGPTSSAGLIVLADDPSDGALDRYFMVGVLEAAAEVDIIEFANGTFTEHTTAAIPPAAAFDPEGLNEFSVAVAAGTITVSVNGVEVVSWSGSLPTGPNYHGFYVDARVVNDAMVVDDFHIEPQ